MTAHTHEVQFQNKLTGKWHQLETFENEKKAEAGLKKQQKKAKFGVYRVAPISIIDNKYNVGVKVRIVSERKRTDGLIDKQVVIAEIVKNNGYQAEYVVVEHEVEENVLMKIVNGAFVIDTATYVVV
ncbi:hypothetical protein D3C81_645150 [compost metagenome]